MMPEPADHSVAALRWFADQLPQISGLAAKTALSTGLAIRTVGRRSRPPPERMASTVVSPMASTPIGCTTTSGARLNATT